LLILSLVACSSTSRGGNQSRLDDAIGLYIAGDYEQAAERLEDLARIDNPDALAVDIHLYLGRTYMAMEQYSRAIDTFRAGKALGGGIVFEEYLLRLDGLVSGASNTMASSMRINRGQLASAVMRLFGDREAADTGGAGETDTETVVWRVVVPPLPDGSAHSEDQVTRAAFYAVVARLVDYFSLGRDPASFFDGGYSWVFTDEADQPGGTAYVSGRDALAILEQVAAERQNDGG
jgi:tetratricopeptide (TPR) repeat protein